MRTSVGLRPVLTSVPGFDFGFPSDEERGPVGCGGVRSGLAFLSHDSTTTLSPGPRDPTGRTVIIRDARSPAARFRDTTGECADVS